MSSPDRSSTVATTPAGQTLSCSITRTSEARSSMGPFLPEPRVPTESRVRRAAPSHHLRSAPFGPTVGLPGRPRHALGPAAARRLCGPPNGPLMAQRTTSRRPLIGVTAGTSRMMSGAWADHEAVTVTLHYVEAIRAAGARPVIIAAQDDWSDEEVAELDAVVLTGGTDLDPARFGQDALATDMTDRKSVV